MQSNIEGQLSNFANISNDRIVYRVVITGGPGAGKSAAQAQLSAFFENLGWQVYRVPKTASFLLHGGIRISEMSAIDFDTFQINLFKVMIAMERTYFTLAETCKNNCLVICDRGIMDNMAYMSKDVWWNVLKRYNWNMVELRDNRYNQIIHLVTSADGAEHAYNFTNTTERTETLEEARELDRRTIQAWLGHPDIEIIDNSTDFQTKIQKMIKSVCRRVGIVLHDRLNDQYKKVKFLIKPPLPSDSVFPPFQDFEIVHDYLLCNGQFPSKIRKRGQNGNWSYQYFQRLPNSIEVRHQITYKDYISMKMQRDKRYYTTIKTRRCFFWKNIYFQLDIYKSPNNLKLKDLILLEAYSTHCGNEMFGKLPPFLEINGEVTNDNSFKLSNLSLKSIKN